MLIFHKRWKQYNEIQLTKNKMDLNNRKMTNHPPPPYRNNNSRNEAEYEKGRTQENNKNYQARNHIP